MHIGVVFRINSNKKEKAQKYLERALDINMKNFGSEHFLTQIIKNFLVEEEEQEEEMENKM